MKRTYYVLATKLAWSLASVSGDSLAVLDRKTSGFMLVYDNREDLRAEWPDAHYFAIETGD